MDFAIMAVARSYGKRGERLIEIAEREEMQWPGNAFASPVKLLRAAAERIGKGTKNYRNESAQVFGHG